MVAPMYGLASEKSGERLPQRFVKVQRDRITNTNLTAAAALLMGGSPAQVSAYSGMTMMRNQSDGSMGEQYCVLPTSTSNKGQCNRSILRKAAGGVVAPRADQEMRARNGLNRQASQNRALNNYQCNNMKAKRERENSERARKTHLPPPQIGKTVGHGIIIG